MNFGGATVNFSIGRYLWGKNKFQEGVRGIVAIPLLQMTCGKSVV